MPQILKTLFIALPCFFIQQHTCAQFAPPPGQAGTSAMYKDSSAFVSWATGCTVIRGLQDISNPGSGYASVGDSSLALGQAGSNGVVSLGDGGSAVLTFQAAIVDGPGNDFAVFENSFSDDYLEFGFVEVSSDGLNFFRFPAICNIQDTLQTGPFDLSDATQVNNLAGKYRALYGTPFDLQELAGIPGLNTNAVTQVKIVDVTGSLNPLYATYDSNNHKVNDPWPTPFPSSGFDLDAIGVIHQSTTGIRNKELQLTCIAFPNPATSSVTLNFALAKAGELHVELYSTDGRRLISTKKENNNAGNNSITLNTEELKSGIYFLTLSAGEQKTTIKLAIE